jgi:hypothetical protein
MIKLHITGLMALLWMAHDCTLLVEASHFFGGSMSAMVIADMGTTVNISYTNHFAYKRSNTGLSPNTTWCNDTTIQSKAQFGSTELIYCARNCFTLGEIVGTTVVYCESFSELENWSYGISSFTYAAPKSNNYQVTYPSGSWGPLAAYGAGNRTTANWELRLRQNLNNRSDTNVINTTPVTLSSPFTTLPRGIIYNLKIPFMDVDQDIVRCIIQ